VFMTNLPISRKLAVAFGAVLVTIAAMGALIFYNLLALERAADHRSKVNEDVRHLATAELRLTRQENSFRGYLLSRDPYYIERLTAHGENFDQAIADLRDGASPDMIPHLDKIETAMGQWRQEVAVKGLALARNPATYAEAVAMVGRDGSADAYMSGVEEGVDALKELSMQRLDAVRIEMETRTKTAEWIIIGGVGIALLIALVMGWIISRGLGVPAMAIVSHMRKLMAGDTSITVVEADRKDEFGEMGRAVVAFRDAAIEKVRVEAEAAQAREQAEIERKRNLTATEAQAEEQALVVQNLADGLARLSQGDLTCAIEAEFPGEYAKLKNDFNAAVDQLRDAMAVVVANIGGIRSGSSEISQAADDLSRRTEQQAASLEETAAALDEITATVNRTASGARQASDTVKAAKDDAETSGVVVRDAVTAMGAIEKSAQEISQIIGVIDEIAFQTNLLALNAGVEAARAGEAGRGFAVVASEVRALAQRSAEAAKEIKTLISASTAQVGTGVNLVGQTGEALERIVVRVAEIDTLVAEISASAQEQATGLAQVNSAVNQMDQVTQQNAAMVEQSTAASHSLSREAEALAQSVARFNVGGATGRAAPMHKPAPAPAAAAAPAPAPAAPAPAPRAPKTSPAAAAILKTVGRGGAALKSEQAVSEDGWEEF
jgi:methyl-accepting chemotaxis protein